MGYLRREPVPARDQVRTYVRSLRSGRSDRGVVLFAQGRSGSTVLGSLLDTHPEVHWADEILYRPVALPHRWVEGQRARHPGSVFVFHVKPYQLTGQQGVSDPRPWLARLLERGWSLIYLERSDVLRQALSTAVAAVTGSYHARAGDERRRGPVEVDASIVVEGVRLRERNLVADRATVAELPHLFVHYERDLLDGAQHQPTADRVFAWAGLPPVAVATPLRRTSSAPSEDIANWAEVRTALEAAGLGHHLDGAS